MISSLPRYLSGVALTTAALTAALAPPLPVLAQAPGVTLSEAQTFKNREFVSDPVTFGEGFAVPILRYSRGGGALQIGRLEAMRLQRYDADLRPSGELDVDVGEGRINEGLLSLGDGALWLYTEQARAEGDVRLFAQPLDDGGERGERRELLRYAYGKRVSLQRFSSRSPDGTKRAVFATEYSPNLLLSRDDDVKATFAAVVLDDGGDVVSEADLRMRVERDRVEVLSSAVADDGHAYVTVRVFAKGSKKEKKRGTDAEVRVYALPPGADAFERHRLNTRMYLQNAALVANDAGGVGVFALYAEKRNGPVAGYCYAADAMAEGALARKKFTPRQLEAMGKRITRRKGGELVIEGEFRYDDHVKWSDGRVSVMLESFRVTTQTDMQSGRSTTTYTYRENLVLTLSPEGELLETAVVPKLQQSANSIPPFMGASLVAYGGRPAVVYNDNPKNIGRDLERRTKPLRFRKAAAMLTYETDGGELKQMPLFAARENDFMLVDTGSATTLSNGDVVFLANRFKMFGKNTFNIGRLEAGR